MTLVKTGMKGSKLMIVALVLWAGVGLAAGSASAAEYPKRPISMICPWGAGGGTDAVSRILATLLKTELGVPVNVVNRTGGGGAIGHTAMATARPDGYTIGLATVEITMIHWMGLTRVTYKDITPVCMVNSDPAGINVRADAPWKTYKDLEKYVRENPGKLKSSGTGPGGIWHLAMAGWLKAIGMAPTAIKWIPSKGAAPALQDLMAGGIDMSTCSLPEAATLIDAGRIRPLAIMAEKRDPLFPHVPTLKDMGINWSCGAWRGVVGPKGTPPQIVAVLEKAIKKIVDSQEFKKFMKNRGYGIYWMDSESFARTLAEADEANGQIMKTAGIIK
jgi:tripartite-type tricarboxylate transporter receptor subunit TctC